MEGRGEEVRGRGGKGREGREGGGCVCVCLQVQCL